MNYNLTIMNEKEISNIKYNSIFNNQNYFDNSLNISEIENKEKEQENKIYLNITKNDIENNIQNSLNSYINIEDKSIHQLNKEININKKNRKKLTKEDLNNTPLPIFSCIYCSNEYLSFKHLSSENLSFKYKFQTSIYDMKILDKLINSQPLKEHDNKNHYLVNIIIRNTEYIKKYYLKEDILYFYNSKKFKKLYISNEVKYKRYLIHRLEDCIIRKKRKYLSNKKTDNNKFFNTFHNNNSNSIMNDYCFN